MRESMGKAITRELFFKEFLPGCLSYGQLRAGNYLLLLGEEPRELVFTDELGVNRNQITSIERDGQTFQKQADQHLGVSIFNYDMREFLEFVLHQNQSFLVLNLDVEGSYIYQLDPAMASVLLFCWRNPSTIVATYTNIGRDKTMLLEGVKSLAVFLWLAPFATQLFIQNYEARYRQAGFDNARNLILRDLFWLRSHLENLAIASAMVKITSPQSVKQLFLAEDMIWKAIVEEGKLPLTIGAIQETVHKTIGSQEFTRKIDAKPLPMLGIEFTKMLHVLYRGNPPWSHRGFFAKFRIPLEKRPCNHWAKAALQQFLNAKLVSVDDNGTRRDQVLVTLDFYPIEMQERVFWSKDDIYTSFSPRMLEVKPASDRLIRISETVRSIYRKTFGPVETHSIRRKEVKRMPKGKPYVRNGNLTQAGIDQIRQLARRNDDLNTDEIIGLHPQFESVSKRSITAHIAVARQQNGGLRFTRDGMLTEPGKARIRKLAVDHPRWNTDQIMNFLPKTIIQRIDRGSITANIAVARRGLNNKVA